MVVDGPLWGRIAEACPGRLVEHSKFDSADDSHTVACVKAAVYVCTVTPVQ